MADENLITVELLAANPDWVEKGLKIGDPVPVVKQPDKKPETVVVDRVMLENILKEVGDMRAKVGLVDQLTKDNEMLLAVADKSRLARYQSQHNPQGLVRSARVWLWHGKIVKATVTVRNEAFTDNVGRVHTDQVINVFLEDGSEEEVTYDKFSKEKELVDADIIKRSTDDSNGQTFYTMKLKDGKEIAINYLFLN